jgi:hypothetical protein
MLCAAFLAAAAASAAPPREAKVMLWKNNSLPSGTVVRETREIRSEDGKRRTTDGGKALATEGIRYVHRVNLLRRLGGGDREEVSVRESVRECVFYLGAVPPPADEAGTPLQSLDLRLRRVSGKWTYELDKGTPTDVQRAALAEFNQLADLVSVLALCASPQPRAKGESWKVDVPRLPGKGYGYVVTETLECRLEDVIEGEGGPQARIAVTGKLKLERPLGLNGSVSVTFAGTITRRLSDMLDVEASLNGTFSYTGPVVADGKPATTSIEVPWTLTRTQKIEPK